MPVVVERNGITVIGVNARSGNYRAVKISANVFENHIRLAVLRFGINIETVFVFFVDGSLTSLKGVAKMLVEQIQQSGAEGESEEREVEVLNLPPRDVVAGTGTYEEQHCGQQKRDSSKGSCQKGKSAGVLRGW